MASTTQKTNLSVMLAVTDTPKAVEWYQKALGARLLWSLGSVAGLAVGYVVLRGLLVVAKGPTWLNAAPDWRVVAFALTAGFASAILFGLTVTQAISGDLGRRIMPLAALHPANAMLMLGVTVLLFLHGWHVVQERAPLRDAP